VFAEYLKSAKTIFWDFDGVIKDSIEVKSDAFEKLFLSFGSELAARVRTHHEANGGMSRFEKLPNYLDWAGQKVTAELIDEYAEKFSQLVKQKVVNSEWVPGILDYLKNNHYRQQFFLVTATPQKEMVEILTALEIDHFFKEVVGSPTKKSEAIERLLDSYKVNPEYSMMVGDSISDYNAAVENRVPFILRKTNINDELQKKLRCITIDNYQQ